MKIEELSNVSKVVYAILDVYPTSRNSDNVLYYLVCNQYAKQNKINLDELSVSEFLLQHNELCMPAFETVRRSRQKIQHDHPELSGSTVVNEFRKENEETFKQFARG